MKRKQKFPPKADKVMGQAEMYSKVGLDNV
jgi:hypothetical protein